MPISGACSSCGRHLLWLVVTWEIVAGHFVHCINPSVWTNRELMLLRVWTESLGRGNNQNFFGYVKGEVTIDHVAGTRWSRKSHSGCRNLSEDSKVIEANPLSSNRRVSVEFTDQCGFVTPLDHVNLSIAFPVISKIVSK